MTVYVLGIIATILWVGAGVERRETDRNADIVIAVSCAVAAVVLAIIG